ncbi:MAG: glycoside hydrolase family 65 protein, partial [Burkholderiales bacterium]|nr:glycoside hydrolase family 65 protein [Anaerolineae bacterium]
MTSGRHLWSISEFPFQPEKLSHYETLFSVGNGYLSTRAAFEERYEDDMPVTLVHGIYNQVGEKVPELVNLPNWLDMRISIDGTPLDMTPQEHVWGELPKGVLGFRRTLHMERGLLKREVLFRAPSGGMVRLVFERFANMENVHLAAQRVTITAIDGTTEISIESGIDTDISNDGCRHWTNITTSVEDGRVSVGAVTSQAGYKLGMASYLVSPAPIEAINDDVRPRVRTTFKLEFQASATVDKLTAIYTSRDLPDPLEAAQNAVTEAACVGYNHLQAASDETWDERWQTGDVQIEGDESAQIALRFVMYHILIAAPRHEDRVSIGAKTLSGLGYKGHVFWDTELFIVPTMILTQPDIARNLLMYRYHLLEPARENARINGFEGAMFPWESADTGIETTPKWSDPLPDGSKIRIWTGEREQHISTDIAYAVWQFWRWTGDDAFMRN